MSTEIRHNGANTNLYCDGRWVFVNGCSACGIAEKKIMDPRWERARQLSDELAAAGMSEVHYHADLWGIWAEGIFNGRKVRVEELT